MSMPANTVQRATLERLRADYADHWRREWPYDDGYLSELWLEVQDKNAKGNSRVPSNVLHKTCRTLMRECDEF